MIHFNNPKILYSLFALLIPVIVHLFQLRKFQKVNFTNVKFLKELVVQTRKSSELEKWLILFTRILVLMFIILAFANPYFGEKKISTQKEEVVYYIDNSISTQEKGPKGELLRISIQEFINNSPKEKNLNIITNDRVFKNKKIQSIKNELINLKYTNYQLEYNIISLKAEQLFSDKKSIKKIIYISDFQKHTKLDSSYFSTKHQNILIQTLPISKSNISIDSAYFVSENIEKTSLKVVVRKQNSALTSIPIALYNNDSLISKSNLKLKNSKNYTTFDLPSKNQLNLRISITNPTSTYDNKLFVTKNKTNKLNILAIGEKNTNTFLSKIFTKNEFNFQHQVLSKINFSDFEMQHLIIVNELLSLSNSLIKNLSKYIDTGGSILMIPNENADLKNYNKLTNIFNEINQNETRLTKINFSHPIYSDVFEKEIKNFQFPYFKKHYKLKNFESTILSFENNMPLLVQADNIFSFSAPLNSINSNFKQAPLVVPTLYNIAKSTLKNNVPYYLIGKENSIDFELKLEKDEIISLTNNSVDYIPIQQIKSNKVNIKTKNSPENSGIYNIQKQQHKTNLFVAYNYTNTESLREYHSLNKLKNKNIQISTSLTNTLIAVNSNAQIGSLWKWFIIFALLFLIVELLILKYFK